jgi:sigma-B regulation protein RsbU (phosphoserine phosphatase)
MAAPPPDLEDLYENAPFGYLVMQPDGRIGQANATLVGWIGHSADQIIGKRLHDLLTVGTRIFYETNVAPLLAMHGAFSEVALDLKAADGAKFPVLAVATSRKGGTAVRVAFLRAAERRRYERTLVEAQEASRNSERDAKRLLDGERETSILREQFIAILGHDLRNPVASIGGGLRLLQKEQPEERRKLLLDMLQSSVVRMGALIDNVLDFARGRLGAGIPIEFRQGIWLAPVLEHVAAELRIAAPERVIETDFNLPEPVKCDPSRISQLVSNLLGNAVTHGLPNEAVRLHADTKDGMLTIWVANGGAPIPEETMKHLFQPFFRGDVRASQQGLGLGLYIAHEIAKAHGGTLEAKSTLAETRFIFTMPITTKPDDTQSVVQ